MTNNEIAQKTAAIGNKLGIDCQLNENNSALARIAAALIMAEGMKIAAINIESTREEMHELAVQVREVAIVIANQDHRKPHPH